jgi:hypothetical protein
MPWHQIWTAELQWLRLFVRTKPTMASVPHWCNHKRGRIVAVESLSNTDIPHAANHAAHLAMRQGCLHLTIDEMISFVNTAGAELAVKLAVSVGIATAYRSALPSRSRR